MAPSQPRSRPHPMPALRRQAKKAARQSIKRQTRQHRSSDIDSETTPQHPSTTPLPSSPIAQEPSFDSAQDPESITRNIILQSMEQSMEKTASEVAEFWKQRLMERDEKIHSLEAKLKQMQQDTGEIQEQVVEAVKDARDKQSEAQEYTIVMSEECRELEDINKIQNGLLEERKSFLDQALTGAKLIFHDYGELKKDHMALKEAYKKLKHGAQ